MKQINSSIKKQSKSLWVFILLISLVQFSPVISAEKAPLRRPISPEQPMWLIHIDTWNRADPQKIIDLVPISLQIQMQQLSHKSIIL